MRISTSHCYIHAIIAVENVECCIRSEWKNDLYQYVKSTVESNFHKLIEIGGMPDHIHLLFAMNLNQSLDDLMLAVKNNSSDWLNKNEFHTSEFSWQEGYGAFSCSLSQIPEMRKYIQIQKEIHSEKTFIEEFKEILVANGVDFDKRDIFKAVL